MDSSQVYVDPVELRSFATSLSQFAHHLKDFEGSLQTELDRLGETFRDANYHRFRTAFFGSRQLLMKFVEESQKTVAELKLDADIIAQMPQFKKDA